MAEGRTRPAWAEIDLGALERNARRISEFVGKSQLCAVVKADAYGHGAVQSAEAFLRGGATWLAVALVDEGIELREAGITAPILMLSEPPADAIDAAVEAGLTPTVATADGVRRVASAGERRQLSVPVHLKVDTGMHRVGASLDELPDLLTAIATSPTVELEGLYTHLAVADSTAEDAEAFIAEQLELFEQATDMAATLGLTPSLRHVANSAAALIRPKAGFDMVRVGIALYGASPSPEVADRFGDLGVPSLEPVLTLKARVSAVRRLKAGSRPSYGRVRPLPQDSYVATVPIGYADGVPRALLASGFEVLIHGKRHPLAGTITMDQIVVDCGDTEVEVGAEVVLLGVQSGERISAEDWAQQLGTISYEVLCGIGPRVTRSPIAT
jgi:alanine racemase